MPAEVVAAYLAGQGVLSETSLAHTTVKVISIAFFVVLLALTPAYLASWAAKTGEPKRKHIVIGTVAFAVWVYAVGSLPSQFGFYSGTVGALILIVFSLVSGLIVPAEGEK